MQGHQTIAMMRQLSCFKASGPERSMTEKQTEDKDPHRPVTETAGSRNMHLDFGRGFVLFNESTSQGVTRMPPVKPGIQDRRHLVAEADKGGEQIKRYGLITTDKDKPAWSTHYPDKNPPAFHMPL